MWPECGGKRPSEPGSPPRTNIGPLRDQFLVMQPSLDESWWKGWFGMDGATGALVNKTLSEKADDLPLLPDGTRGDTSWRKAMALAELCITDDPTPAQLTVFVDATQAVPSNGEAGVVLEAGPRIGRDALEAILCDAVTEDDRTSTKMAHQWSTGEDNGPSHPPYAGPSSTETGTPAPATAVPAPTDSKSTTSSPGQKAEPPTPTISSPSAGSTIKSSSTNEASSPTTIQNTDGSDSASQPSAGHRANRRPWSPSEPRSPQLRSSLPQDSSFRSPRW